MNEAPTFDTRAALENMPKVTIWLAPPKSRQDVRFEAVNINGVEILLEKGKHHSVPLEVAWIAYEAGITQSPPPMGSEGRGIAVHAHAAIPRLAIQTAIPEYQDDEKQAGLDEVVARGRPIKHGGGI